MPTCRLRTCCLLSLALAPGCALLDSHAEDPRAARRGPVAMRPHQPNKLTFLALPLRTPNTVAQGRSEFTLHSAYSSMFENGIVPDESVVLDGEIWRTAGALRHGVGPDTDVEFELAVVYASSGFLDRFVESWHELLGLPGGGREERPRFEYEMELTQNGQQVYELEGHEVGLGDLPIVVTHRLLEAGAGTPALALRAGIELPTGSESKGFGNGELDAGAGVLVEQRFGRWILAGSVDYVLTGQPSSFAGAGVDARDDLALQFGSEYLWNDQLSLLAGLALHSPVTDDFDIPELDSEILSLDLALAFDLGRESALTIGFEEDLIAESGPDFTVFAAWRVGL